MVNIAAAHVSYTIEFDGEVRNPINQAKPVGEYIREIVILVTVDTETAANYTQAAGIPLSGVLTNVLLGIDITRIIDVQCEPLHRYTLASKAHSPVPAIHAFVDVAGAEITLAAPNVDDVSGQSGMVELDDATDVDAILGTSALIYAATRIRILAREPYPS